MENVMNYENAIAQAACVASNLAEMATIALESTIPTPTGQKGKKGAVVVDFNGALDEWLDGYLELVADGNAKAAKVIVATLNTASGKIEEYAGRVSIQKVDGDYVFVMQPAKAKSDENHPLIDAATELAKGLTVEQEEKLAALLREVSATI